jgi:hypothetical protein
VSVPFTKPEISPAVIGFDGGTVGVITFVVSDLEHEKNTIDNNMHNSGKENFVNFIIYV